MQNVLFLASTPLHSFWSLGIACGRFSQANCVLALIDQRAGDRDYIADVLATGRHRPFTRVERFGQIGKAVIQKLRRARTVLHEVRQLAEALDPAYIAVGNDRRAEFYAALAGAPSAVGAYMDDGLFSYMPMGIAPQSPLMAGIRDWGRGMLYGMRCEHPDLVGGSRAAREAWVLLPEQVHAGLQPKQVHRIEAGWYQDPVALAICRDALALSGLDPQTAGRIRLLLVLPHESFLRAQPAVLAQLEEVVARFQARGLSIAFKRHPRSTESSLPLPGGCVELPRRLPIEIVAPLLQDTLVVGSLTTALLTLRHLGNGLDVRYFDYPGASATHAIEIYRSAGLQPL